MKKQILLIMCVMGMSLITNAQEWHILGNTGTDPATDYLGTSDAKDLVIRTDATQRLRIGATSGAFNFGTNTTTGVSSAAFGASNTVSGAYTFSTGTSNHATALYAVAMGTHCTSASEAGFALGDNCEVTANGHDSFALGEFLEADEVNTFVFGKGPDVNNPLYNGIPNSLMVGFENIEPTFFVGGDNNSDGFGRVGIATSSPEARLHVIRDASSETGTQKTTIIEMEGTNASNAINEGLYVELNTPDGESQTQTNRAIHSLSQGTNKNYTIFSEALTTSETSDNRGVYSKASGNGTSVLNNIGVYGNGYQGVRSTGVYGEASGASTANIGVYGTAAGNGAYAGFFNGAGYLLATSWTYGSDQMLKTNVQELQGALSIIDQLKPKTFDYAIDAFPQLNLPSGNHFGFIAQEVEEPLPGVVDQIEIPQSVDQEGNVLTEALTIKGIRQTEMLPIAIAAIQEQQVIIQQQAQLISAITETVLSMQQQLNDVDDNIVTLSEALTECCQIELELRSMSGFDIQIVPTKTKLNELYQNTPNPFEAKTTIAYSLAEACNAKVVIMNQTGQIISTLVDGYNEVGLHQVEWNSGSLSDGVYYYALVVDGIELVKKAVKLY